MRRSLRLAAAGVILALTAMSGLVMAPAPEPARGALAAVGVNDSLTMKHDRTAVVAAPGVLGNDLNLVGGTTAILVSGVSHGTLSLQANGGYTYSPSAGYVGGDSFIYRPSGLLSTAATVTITITNATPVANPDAYSGSAGTTLVVAAPGVLANDTDADADPLVTQQVGGVTGSLNLNANGGFQYTPGGGFSGTATFNYRVWDGAAWSLTTTVSLTISAPASTPTPSPTPTPTPTPTPKPTPRPLPLPSLPLPSIPLPTPPVPLPSVELPLQPTPIPTSIPVLGLGPGETPSPGGAAPGPGSGTDTPSGQTPDSSGVNRPDLSLSLPSINLGTGTVGVVAGLEIWAVPAAVIGGPGLLVLLWMALQAAGATAWIPAARRLRDDEASKPRRGRTAA